MNTDLRRSKRYNDFLAVSVLARDKVSGKTAAGPFAGRIINISRHGACLLMSLGVPDTYNVYRSTFKNDTKHIEIHGDLPPEINQFRLSGKPMWMDPFVLDDIKAFKIGIEFITSADYRKSEDIIEDITAERVDDLIEFEIKE